MALFLSAGADLRLSLSCPGLSHSLEEFFIREYLARRYPAEPAEVISEYEKAILRERRKRGWNEAHERGEEDGQIKEQRHV